MRVLARELAPHSIRVNTNHPSKILGTPSSPTAFFSLLQKNVLDRQCGATREQLRIANVTWIERTYHRRRRQDALGRLTPIEYELIMTTPGLQAA